MATEWRGVEIDIVIMALRKLQLTAVKWFLTHSISYNNDEHTNDESNDDDNDIW